MPTHPSVADLIEAETTRQTEDICLIASENHASPAVRSALGSVLVNKYAEGYPGKRYYAGNQIIDQIEQRAIDLAQSIFSAEHANVQPLSGAPANLAIYAALLKPGDTVLGMDLSHGGHLTHGHPVTLSAKLYNFIRYKTTPDGALDYDAMMNLARTHKPKLILVGYSSYSRDIDYQKVQAIADEVDALTMADISHISGLIAAGLMNNPVPIFDVVMTTTHKTLRGPRGGLILCKAEHAAAIDKSVFPGLQGGPHENQVAALAVALEEANTAMFKAYAKQTKENAATLASELTDRGFTLAFGRTENHMLLVDLRNKQVSGKQAQEALEKAGIIANMNVIPDDPAKPTQPSGIRLGTPAITTRGMKESEVRNIAGWIDEIVDDIDNPAIPTRIRREVHELARAFPPPSDIV